MQTILLDALKDSLELLPFLLVIYIGIAWLEYRFGQRIQAHIRHARKAGPLLGAVFGCLPQCGFSVVGGAMYARGLVSTGTLLAVFISTSDEAVPIILANPSRLGLIVPLLLTKVLLALGAGYLVDAFSRPRQVLVLEAAPAPVPVASSHDHADHAPHEETAPADADVEVDGCCGHHLPEENRMRMLLIHPLRHTAQVFLILLLISVGINMLVGQEGANLGALLQNGSIWQPVVAALVGLIPNCGASVALTDIYLQHGISFGALIAGLSTSAGLGLLVLVKENRDPRDTVRVLGLLLGICIAAGILLQYLEQLFPALPR